MLQTRGSHIISMTVMTQVTRNQTLKQPGFLKLKNAQLPAFWFGIGIGKEKGLGGWLGGMGLVVKCIPLYILNSENVYAYSYIKPESWNVCTSSFKNPGCVEVFVVVIPKEGLVFF